MHTICKKRNKYINWNAKKKKIMLLVQEMEVQSLGQEDPLEEEMATHSSILAWNTHEQPGGLQSKGLQRIRQNWMTKHTHTPQVGSALLF